MSDCKYDVQLPVMTEPELPGDVRREVLQPPPAQARQRTAGPRPACEITLTSSPRPVRGRENNNNALRTFLASGWPCQVVYFLLSLGFVLLQSYSP